MFWLTLLSTRYLENTGKERLRMTKANRNYGKCKYSTPSPWQTHENLRSSILGDQAGLSFVPNFTLLEYVAATENVWQLLEECGDDE